MLFVEAKRHLLSACLSDESVVVGIPDKLLEQIEQHYRPASILMAIMNIEGQAELLISKRSEQLALHPGEIAFPGGKPDSGDENVWQTALREAYEEVGLSAGIVNPIGQLNKRITRSDFLLSPCVGLIEKQTKLQANPQEVADIFTLPLSELMLAEKWQFDWLPYRGEERFVPRYEYGEHSVTGVTAMLIVDLMNQVFDAQIPSHD